MNKNEIIIPTKDEVIKLLTIAKNDEIIHMQTVSELLGMKLLDSYMPKIKGEPKWGYGGLKKFFVDYDIDFSCDFEEALEKLNTH